MSGDDERLMPVSEVARMLGMSKTTVWEMVRRGTIPTPLKFGPRMSRWRLTDIKRVIAEAEEAGRADAARSGRDR